MEDNEQDGMTPDRARAMFRRILSAWAMDNLRLRRAGLDVPSARRLMLRGGGPRPGPAGRVAAQFPSDDAQERAA
jgi:hypothetical protein